MNKTFYAIGMLLLIAYNEAAAQKSETALLTKSSILNRRISAEEVAAPVMVSAAVVEKFKKEYRNVKDVEWTEIKEGYRAYFSQDDILTAVDYNKKGKLYSTIRYGKKLLSDEVAGMLNEQFTNPEVREVSEVKIADFASKVYVIVLEDNTSMKTVQVLDDEVKVISEIRK